MLTSSPVDLIKDRVSIADVVGQRVRLLRAGRNLKGLCPFHPEKSPSFVVFPDKGNYHCFGCGANGDVFSFTMRTENVEFAEALTMLAARAGVELRPRAARGAEDEHRERLLAINSMAAQFFQSALASGAGTAARDYLARRGVLPATIEAFQIGWAPDSWDALLTYLAGQGVNAAEAVEVGLAVPRDTGGQYDRFRARVVFPIRDQHGNVTGFGGRGLGDEQPKYLNTAQTPVFDKGGSLFGLDRARAFIRQIGEAVIVEGYMDVIIAHQAGIENVVASLGTALTDRQVGILKRLTKKIVLALDPDAAGNEATLRGLETIRQTYGQSAVPVAGPRGMIRLEYRLDADIRIASLPDDKDPDEIILTDPAGFRGLIAEARPIVDFFMDSVLARTDLTSAREKATAVRRVLELIGELRDQVQAAHYVQLLSTRARVSETVLTDELRRLRAQSARPPAAVPAADERPILSLEDYVLVLLLDYPELAPRVWDLDVEEISRAETRELLTSLQSYVNRHGTVDSSALHDVVTEFLLSYLDDLLAWSNELPKLSADDLNKEIDDRLKQLRRHRLRSEIATLEQLQRDAREDGDDETSRAYSERTTILLAELVLLEKQRAEPRNWRDTKRRPTGKRSESERQARLSFLSGDDDQTGPGASTTVAAHEEGTTA
ncbi:MAG TPA: DNA primase [Chloroflexota bacterium]|nr:DNA primase [Chloroflexota bacterium]